MKKIFILTIVVFCTTCVSGETKITTKRARNEVREGPGSFYDLLQILPRKIEISILKTEGSWHQIRTPDKSRGWINNNCLQEVEENMQLQQIESEWISPAASKAGVAAAIRGFADRYITINDSMTYIYTQVEQHNFTSNEYINFRNATLTQWNEIDADDFEDEHQIYFQDYTVNIAEEGIGHGVAARIAAWGLYRNSEATRYVNLVGAYIAEASNANDFPFHFLILDDERVGAYSVPGGYIFITKTMLSLCSNEAELAGVLAHEVMHVILHHGLKEIGVKENEIKMEHAFRELEQETQMEKDSAEQALEEFAQEAWDIVNTPRTNKMEMEADNGAAILLARAGYDTRSLVNLIEKIESDSRTTIATNLEDERPFSFIKFKERKEKLQKFISEYLSKTKGNTFTERFRRTIK
jgi:Zn-dependent protease with chaperone function